MVSRFSVVESPALHPGACWITGSQVGPFIDTQTDVPFEKRGHVYIGLDALREMAFEAGLFKGLVPEARVQEAYNNGRLDALKEDTNGTADRLSAELRRAADRIDAVRTDAEAAAEAARV
jgi:hypothetical protein